MHSHIRSPLKLSLTLLLCILFTSTPSLAQEVLNICIVNNKAPYSFKEKGKWYGFDVDIFNRLTLPTKHQFVETDFAVALAMLEQGQCSMLIPSVKVTEDIHKRFLTTTPHLHSDLRALVLKDSHIQSVPDLEYCTLGVLKDSTAEDFVFEEMKDSTILALTSEDEIIKLLLTGEIEAMVGSKQLLQKSAKKHPELKMLEYQLKNEQISFIFSKKNATLRDIVNAQLLRLQSDGVLSHFYQKWIEE